MSGWNALFVFRKPLEELSFKETANIKFQIEELNGKIIINSFIIYTPVMSKEDAIIYVNERANRVLDYMTALHNIPIECNFNNIGTTVKPGECSTREAYLGINANVIKKTVINFESIRPIMENKMGASELQLMRQLSHFRRGLEAKDDIVTQIREFFMVVEDEYADHDNSFDDKYSYIRHFVCHSELDLEDAKKKAMRAFRKTYFDPSDPQTVKRLEKDLKGIKEEAFRILYNKMGF